MRTSLSPVPSVELPSYSVPKNRNYSHHEAMPTIPNAVPTVARQEEQSATGTPVIVLRVKCFRLYAPNVDRKQKYRSNPAKIDPYIAEHAI